jgi:glyoxylase-like metal-dependent hydrolase (beta-lactamase superfamily II)
MSYHKPIIETVLPCFYRVEIPLPQTPLQALNSYIITSGERALIIDTGMNEKVCLDAMTNAINELDIDLDNSDFFITHSHSDHVGLIPTLALNRSVKVFFNRPEINHVNSESIIEWAEKSSIIARRNGYYRNGIRQMVAGVTRGEKRFVWRQFDIKKEGDIIGIGDYKFIVIETPGHSRGHMCLYEPVKKLLVSGDHILNDITPNISSRFNDDENPLREYLSSLDKVYSLDVSLALPGHRSMITDIKGRINEIKNHHKERLEEVLNLLRKSSRNAFEVASKMKWDMTYENWEEFPIYPKWFAFSEALSHLQYLESQGKIRRLILPDQQIIYSII